MSRLRLVQLLIASLSLLDGVLTVYAVTRPEHNGVRLVEANPLVAPVLERALRDQYSTLAWLAVKTLGALLAVELVLALESMLSQRLPPVRLWARIVLALMLTALVVAVSVTTASIIAYHLSG